MEVKEKEEYYLEITEKNTFGIDLRELILYKELFYFFTWRDISVKYKQTILGVLWAILQPLLLMVIFTFFIGKSLHVPSDEMEYSVFVFSGLILWLIFSSGLTNSGNSMIANANIIRKIYFPRLIIPISSVLVSVFDFLMAFIVFIALLVFYQQPVNIFLAVILWPVGLMLTMLGTFGPGCLLAALSVKYRDFRYIIPFLIQALLFVTPVIYPVSVIKYEWMRYLLAINPMYAAITLFRAPMSSAILNPDLICISILSGIIFFFLGVFYFRRTERYFADLA
jgi:lipopolysaccharide transport system permease protein